MNKQIKKILKNSPLTIKWYNINEWKKEKFNNLYDFVEFFDIKIQSKKDNNIKIIFEYADYKTICYCRFDDFEKHLIILIKQYYLYLGDKIKIKTKFN